MAAWETDVSLVLFVYKLPLDVSNSFAYFSMDNPKIDSRAIYTRKNKTRTVPFIRACLI